jgi:hypothetical protein
MLQVHLQESMQLLDGGVTDIESLKSKPLFAYAHNFLFKKFTLFVRIR